MTENNKNKRGLPKGSTNNPAGRPVGSKNKNPNTVKKLFEEFSNDKFEQFKKDYDAVSDPYQRARLYLDVSKPLIPRPLNEEEKNAQDDRTKLIKRLFGKTDD